MNLLNVYSFDVKNDITVMINIIGKLNNNNKPYKEMIFTQHILFTRQNAKQLMWFNSLTAHKNPVR